MMGLGFDLGVVKCFDGYGFDLVFGYNCLLLLWEEE